MAQLICRDLCLGYEGREILHDLSFRVDTGDYLCIVGENGSGKTTLMKTLLGLHRPLSGEVIFGEGVRKNQIGYLPQQTAVQKDFPASAEEIVLSGFQGQCGLRPFYTKEQKIRAREAMERMGVLPLAKRCYREMSGGQQQRVLLARALCATEAMLLLDEPTAGLDPNVTAELYALIAQINREGVTVLMISHDTAAALRYASHILHIGQRVFFGTRDSYLQTEDGKRFARKGNENESV